MNKMIKWLVLIGSILAFSSAAEAQPTITWDDSTRLALAQCFVGEAGWRNRTEHSTMAHILVRRWERVAARRPAYTFEQMVRAYCAVHRVRTPSERQRWVRALPWGPMIEDPGMNAERTNWHNWADDWDFTRDTVALFEAGSLRDPLPHAEHWGGHMDGVPVGGILLARTVHSVEGEETVEYHNFFYRIDPEVARRYRAARRAVEAGRALETIPAEIASGGRT